LDEATVLEDGARLVEEDEVVDEASQASKKKQAHNLEGSKEDANKKNRRTPKMGMCVQEEAPQQEQTDNDISENSIDEGVHEAYLGEDDDMLVKFDEVLDKEDFPEVESMAER